MSFPYSFRQGVHKKTTRSKGTVYVMLEMILYPHKGKHPSKLIDNDSKLATHQCMSIEKKIYSGSITGFRIREQNSRTYKPGQSKTAWSLRTGLAKIGSLDIGRLDQLGHL